MSVYRAIACVQGELARDGIQKDRRNGQQGYNFRGIDDVFNALAPLLAKHGLCILPRVLSRDVTERATAKGGVLFYVTLDVEFDFVSAEDGSKHTIRVAGEAMDSADKATNKAMSAAYKYAALMTFAIPTEGDNDADATTHDVAPRQQQRQPDAAPRITDEQRHQLMMLAEYAGVDARTLCTKCKIGALPDLSAENFDAVRKWLEGKLDKSAPAAATEPAQQHDDILSDEVPF